MRKQYIFYHIYLIDGVNSIINEQLNLLISSNILKYSELFVTIINNNPYKLDETNYNIIQNISKDIFYCNENLFEIITLKRLYDHSIKNDGNYLYIHTKGCSRLSTSNNGVWFGSQDYSYKNVENWRHILEHFTIENWNICINELKNYDLVGCNYVTNNLITHPGHYSGNFWWSKSEFINKLPDPQIYLNKIDYNINIFIFEHDRFNAEFWIGKINHKALCLYPPPSHNAFRALTYTDKNEYQYNIIKNEYYNNI